MVLKSVCCGQEFREKNNMSKRIIGGSEINGEEKDWALRDNQGT